MQIDCDGSYNSYYCCSTESADSREECSLTSQLRKITWYDFSMTHYYFYGAMSPSDLLSPSFPSLFSSLFFVFLFPSPFFPSIFCSLLPSACASRGALTIEEAIESLRALLKAVELQEEDSVEEEEEEEESKKGEDQSKSNTVVTPSASKAATYRSYTISEIIRITE